MDSGILEAKMRQWTSMDCLTCPMGQWDRMDCELMGSSGETVNSHGLSHISHGTVG